MSHKIITREDRQLNSNLIVQLAKQAVNNLPLYDRWQRHMAAEKFRREFRRVAIALPRQSGHSTAALQIMYEYPDALCFVPNGNARDSMRSLLKQFTDDSETIRRIDHHTRVAGTSALSILYAKERSFVIFDGASSIRKEDMEQVIETFPSQIILELQ